MYASPAAADVSRHDATQQRTTHRRSRRVTSACPRRCSLLRSEEGVATTQTETSHVASASAAAATAHTHRSRHSAGCSRRGCSRRSGTCLQQQQHVSHATCDDAGEAATNGQQTPLTAAGPAVGAAAGAAACTTHHSDASTVTAAHTTVQHMHADSDATSVALTAAGPPAPAEGTAGEAAA